MQNKVFLVILSISLLSNGSGSTSEVSPKALEGTFAVQTDLPYGMDLGQARDAFTFEKEVDDLKCNDKLPIEQGPVGSFSECKSACLKDIRCKFAVYFIKRKWCESHETCATRVPDTKCSIWKLLSPCDKAIPYYYQQIPSHIPPSGIVRGSPPNQNIHCECQTFAWMFCGIYFAEGPEQDAITAKLGDKEDPDRLAPFFLMVSMMRPNAKPICYVNPMPNMPPVYAEIDIFPQGKCFNVNQCLRGTPEGRCPFLNRPFSSGDVVYIRRSDEDRALKGEPVPCIAMRGLRAELTSEKGQIDGGVLDPFTGKTGIQGIMMSEDMFDTYFVFDDDALAQGACLPIGSPGSVKLASGSGDSQSAGPSSVESPPSKSKKKSRRGGSGKKKPETDTDSLESRNQDLAAEIHQVDLRIKIVESRLKALLSGSAQQDSPSPDSDPLPSSLPAPSRRPGAAGSSSDPLLPQNVPPRSDNFNLPPAAHTQGSPDLRQRPPSTLIGRKTPVVRSPQIHPQPAPLGPQSPQFPGSRVPIAGSPASLPLPDPPKITTGSWPMAAAGSPAAQEISQIMPPPPSTLTGNRAPKSPPTQPDTAPRAPSPDSREDKMPIAGSPAFLPLPDPPKRTDGSWAMGAANSPPEEFQEESPPAPDTFGQSSATKSMLKETDTAPRVESPKSSESSGDLPGPGRKKSAEGAKQPASGSPLKVFERLRAGLPASPEPTSRGAGPSSMRSGSSVRSPLPVFQDLREGHSVRVPKSDSPQHQSPPGTGMPRSQSMANMPASPLSEEVSPTIHSRGSPPLRSGSDPSSKNTPGSSTEDHVSASIYKTWVFQGNKRLILAILLSFGFMICAFHQFLHSKEDHQNLYIEF